MMSYLSRPEGRIAYDRAGEGPMVLMVPGGRPPLHVSVLGP